MARCRDVASVWYHRARILWETGHGVKVGVNLRGTHSLQRLNELEFLADTGRKSSGDFASATVQQSGSAS